MEAFAWLRFIIIALNCQDKSLDLHALRHNLSVVCVFVVSFHDYKKVPVHAALKHLLKNGD